MKRPSLLLCVSLLIFALFQVSYGLSSGGGGGSRGGSSGGSGGTKGSSGSTSSGGGSPRSTSTSSGGGSPRSTGGGGTRTSTPSTPGGYTGTRTGYSTTSSGSRGGFSRSGYRGPVPGAVGLGAVTATSALVAGRGFSSYGYGSSYRPYFGPYPGYYYYYYGQNSRANANNGTFVPNHGPLVSYSNTSQMFTNLTITTGPDYGVLLRFPQSTLLRLANTTSGEQSDFTELYPLPVVGNETQLIYNSVLVHFTANGTLPFGQRIGTALQNSTTGVPMFLFVFPTIPVLPGPPALNTSFLPPDFQPAPNFSLAAIPAAGLFWFSNDSIPEALDVGDDSGYTVPDVWPFYVTNDTQVAAFGLLVSADYILLQSSDDLVLPQPSFSPISGKAAATFTVMGDDGSNSDTAAIALSQPFVVTAGAQPVPPVGSSASVAGRNDVLLLLISLAAIACGFAL